MIFNIRKTVTIAAVTAMAAGVLGYKFNEYKWQAKLSVLTEQFRDENLRLIEERDLLVDTRENDRRAFSRLRNKSNQRSEKINATDSNKECVVSESNRVAIERLWNDAQSGQPGDDTAP